ncbi:hypothetical protein ACIG0C_01980 [Kitasatospora aureofaciens]|uniref:DUF1918 domain-containing protein n=1 Tax=Kitasatospora aureofaciens TaxID=1894 RepID=A0A1E7N1J3_KITAU|nr:hypothetical protein [Kitasatospora aureofaciens]ARF79345.1 hypothetical protein B6264_10805 [Kitasatospora aureofaciens]OEV34554.1 hypothetical protein HS99_0035275 [Kitasatospora aureofaciens]GGU67076.1 hypothetical protein GCM10010502_17740 [Kitasatospora aureofaciens]
MAPRKATRTIYKPKIGEIVRDRAHKGVEGTYMGIQGGMVYLRPRGGGQEWETYPSEIEALPNGPELIAVMRPSTPRCASERTER